MCVEVRSHARRRGNKSMTREAGTHSEQLFHSLVEHSAGAIILFTPDGTITYANAATSRIIGYATQELAGMNSFAFMHPDDKEQVLHLLTNLVEQAENAVPLEYRLCHQDGTW